MIHSRRRSLLSYALALPAMLFFAVLRAEAPADLTGTWILNASLSDDPAQVMRDARQDSGGAGGGMLSRVARGISVFGIPIGSLPLPAGGSDHQSEEPDDLVDVDYALGTVEEIRVLQEATATQFEYGENELVSYAHGVNAQTGHGTAIAEWNRHGFTVEHVLDNGTKVIEVYSLDGAADQLHWTVSVKAKKTKAFSISRVYDRDRPGGAPSSDLNLVASAPSR